MVKAVDVPLVSLGESSIPIIGLGTWKSPPGKVKEAVIAAIEAGYRHIDCALVYENEKEIGEAISEKIVDGTVTREELFITTKVWNTFHRRDLVAVSLGQSLSALGLNYVDLTLVHWPMGYKEGDTLFPKDESGNFLCSEATLQETWEGMENLVHRGLTRMIGVSNFNSKQLQYILDIGKIKPVVNQVESHPWLVQTMLINFCQERGIAVEAYSPLGSPDRPWAKKDDPKSLPIVGLGTWKSAPGKVTEAVKAAIDAGYRHIDCALVYQNEKEIGDAIAAKIADGTVKREDLFVTTKVWNTFHRRDLVEGCLRNSLTDLQLDYVDLTLVHWPMAYKEGDELFPKNEDGKFLYSDVPMKETWEAMEDLVAKGLTKMIGLSNFNSKQIQEVLDEGKIKPVVNQVESHPWLVQTKLIDFCKAKGIAVEAYSPLGSPDRPWAKKDDPVLLADPVLVQRGVIVLPKSVTRERIEQNIDVFDFTLSDEDMKTIANMDKGKEGRCCGLEWTQPSGTP
ncbi:unnamed protein product [Cyprideis torosa]|uniref:Uncharacterized protein n=1 Tax=Cyprideis torosa TaxID=163714 RepID=A0A7R8WFD6_9CRUS|nr:unnamed protein product [Cyprideis torosa]CAG0891732.1 unnamed protein product [Cyprideis torosa]